MYMCIIIVPTPVSPTSSTGSFIFTQQATFSKSLISCLVYAKGDGFARGRVVPVTLLCDVDVDVEYVCRCIRPIDIVAVLLLVLLLVVDVEELVVELGEVIICGCDCSIKVSTSDGVTSQQGAIRYTNCS